MDTGEMLQESKLFLKNSMDNCSSGSTVQCVDTVQQMYVTLPSVVLEQLLNCEGQIWFFASQLGSNYDETKTYRADKTNNKSYSSTNLNLWLPGIFKECGGACFIVVVTQKTNIKYINTQIWIEDIYYLQSCVPLLYSNMGRAFAFSIFLFFFYIRQ